VLNINSIGLGDVT